MYLTRRHELLSRCVNDLQRQKDGTSQKIQTIYDGPLFNTVNIVKPNRFGVPRTSLRLTELVMSGGMPEFCLSLEMLGVKQISDAKLEAASRTRNCRKTQKSIDMTRFTTELDHEVLFEAPSERQVVTDFLELIGGAVNVTDDEAFDDAKAYWVFTVDKQVKQVLDMSGIAHCVLAEGNNGDMDLYFCIVNPATSFEALTPQ